MSVAIYTHRKSLLLGSILLLVLAVGISSSQPEPAQEISALGLSASQPAGFLPFAPTETALVCGPLEVNNPLPVGPLDELMSTTVKLNCVPCAQSCGGFANMCGCFPICFCCIN